MSRVAYNRPISQVGFRAHRKTDSFSAANLSGLGALGDDAATLAARGFSSTQIQQIIDAHASGSLSGNGYLFILQGGVPPDDLTNFFEQDPGFPESGQSPSASGAPSPSTTPTQTVGVPTGSTITYQGNLPGAFFSSADEIVSKVSTALPGLGLTLVGYQKSQGLLNAPSTVILTVRVSGPGFNFIADAQAQIDHAIYAVTGQMPAGSSAAVSGVPGGAGGGTAPQPQSLTAWFEQNATLLFLGVGAMVLLPNLIGGRR